MTPRSFSSEPEDSGSSRRCDGARSNTQETSNPRRRKPQSAQARRLCADGGATIPVARWCRIAGLQSASSSRRPPKG